MAGLTVVVLWQCHQQASSKSLSLAWVQVLPVERGRGMQQPGMQAAQARLAAGEWVHIFPEGTRSPDGTTMGPVRAGVGRLVAGCAGDDPVVLPIVHDGMQRVMPRGTSVPVPGQEV